MRINRGLMGRGVTHLIGRDFVISETNCCVNNVRRRVGFSVCFVFIVATEEKKKKKKIEEKKKKCETSSR